MNRRRFLKQAGLAAAGTMLADLSRAHESASAASTSGNSLRILCANIRWDAPTDYKTGDGWTQRKNLCVEILKSRSPDILCLQECKPGQGVDLKAMLPEFASYALLGRDATGLDPLNIIFFSRERFELVSASGYWMSPTPQVPGSRFPDCKNARNVNWVRLKDRRSGRDFRVVNTHLAPGLQEPARFKGAEMIVRDAAAYPKDYPQVLTGDMNSEPQSRAIKAFKDGGWTDTYLSVHGNDDPLPSWHGYLGPDFSNAEIRVQKLGKKYADLKTAYAGRLQHKIDWIFTRGALRASAAEIVQDGRDGKYPSDHYFLLAEVGFAAPA